MNTNVSMIGKRAVYDMQKLGQSKYKLYLVVTRLDDEQELVADKFYRADFVHLHTWCYSEYQSSSLGDREWE